MNPVKRSLNFFLLILSILVQCTPKEHSVVLYCALDRNYAEPLINKFQDSTGIAVQVVYDTEINKTVGLVNRIIAEKQRPQCDIFWNNEIIRTIILKNRGLLQPMSPTSGNDISPAFKDSHGYWYGFAARGRVIIYNKINLKNRAIPQSIQELANAHWRGRAAIAYPLFGTTATHFALLYDQWGEEKARHFFQCIVDNQIGILDGNATVRDRVVTGDYDWGLTDTDDAHGAILGGAPVRIVYPDQAEDGLGMPLIPNTVAMIKGAPHPEAARKLADFILSPFVERELARGRSAQIPVRPDIEPPTGLAPLDGVRITVFDYNKTAGQITPATQALQTIFSR